MSTNGPRRPASPEDAGFAPSPRTGPGTVWADRVGTRRLVGWNQRGVQIPIGHGEGEISPGELLKLALAGCAGMSCDLAIGRRLGEDFPLRVLAHGASDEQENRYLSIAEELQLDVAGLDDEQVERLSTVVAKAIEVGCTVERTLTTPPAIAHGIIDRDAAATDRTA